MSSSSSGLGGGPGSRSKRGKRTESTVDNLYGLSERLKGTESWTTVIPSAGISQMGPLMWVVPGDVVLFHRSTTRWAPPDPADSRLRMRSGIEVLEG